MQSIGIPDVALILDAANHAPQYIQNNCDLEHGKIRISVCVLIH